MKAIILFLMLFAYTAFSQVSTNGVFVVTDKQNSPSYELVGKGLKGNSEQFVLGKTYGSEKNSFSIVTSNQTVSLKFSNGLVSKVNTNSNFMINYFNQEVFESGEPQRVKVGSHNVTTTLLEGENHFIFSGGNEHSICTVSTPLMDLELHKGQFYVSVTKKGVVAFVLEGSLKCHGERGRETVIEAGKAVVALPNQQMRGIEETVFINVKKIKDDEILTMKTETKSILLTSDKFVFIIHSGQVFAANID